MILAVIGLVAASSSPALPTIDTALSDALNFDAKAYYQICGRADRKSRFEALQKRAIDLNQSYAKLIDPNAIVVRYVDRRAVGQCKDGDQFEKTISDWSDALDKIDVALKEAQ